MCVLLLNYLYNPRHPSQEGLFRGSVCTGNSSVERSLALVYLPKASLKKDDCAKDHCITLELSTHQRPLGTGKGSVKANV